MLQQRSAVVLCCAGFMGIYTLVLVSFLLGYMEFGFLFNLVCPQPCSMLQQRCLAVLCCVGFMGDICPCACVFFVRIYGAWFFIQFGLRPTLFDVDRAWFK